MKAALLASLLVAAAPEQASQPVSRQASAAGAILSVSAPSGSVRTGEPLLVEFRVERPTGTGVLVPAFKSPMGVWDVRQVRSIPSTPQAPDQLVEQLSLVTFESGAQVVPPMSFTLRAADGTETVLTSPELPVEVRSLLTEGFDPTRIRDVKGAVPVPLEPIWPWYAGGAGLAALLAWMAWRWWKGRAQVSPPPEPVDVRALRELDELAARELPAKGLVLDFYVLLSDTVRRYVEGRFGIRAPEQTTKEFLQAARHHPAIREDHQRMLAAFMRAADLVKFAAQRPGRTECEHGLEAARGFVQESRSASVPTELTPDVDTTHDRPERVP
ncbi:MAG: hypothetical protein ACO32J_05480 [Phycisphaerales bacterium]|jgi:hypothetical protein